MPAQESTLAVSGALAGTEQEIATEKCFMSKQEFSY